VPSGLAEHRLGVRINKDLVGIISQPHFRTIRAVDPVPINLPGPHVREIGMPNMICILGELKAQNFLPALRTVKKAQLNLACMF
jgi:hypothetical protein